MGRTMRVKRAIAIGAIGVVVAGTGLAGRTYAKMTPNTPRHITRSQVTPKYKVHNHHNSRTHKHHHIH